MSDRPSYPVGVNVFLVRDGKLLLGQRKNAAGEGAWGLPGGHLEMGESMMAAAARELKEETDLNVVNLEFVNLVNDKSGDRHYLQVGFKASGVEGEPKLMEPDRCSEWRWFGFDELQGSVEIFRSHQNQIKIFLEEEAFSDE